MGSVGYYADNNYYIFKDRQQFICDHFHSDHKQDKESGDQFIDSSVFIYRTLQEFTGIAFAFINFWLTYMDPLHGASGSRDTWVPEYMWLFCLTTYAILLVKVRLGHISTIDNLRDRRHLFFVDKNTDQILQGVRAPLLIRVETATYLEVLYNMKCWHPF